MSADLRIVGMDEILRQLHEATSDVLRPEDHAALRAIEAACARDTRELANLVMAYYADADRAARTPHAWLQLHIGMVAGRLQRVAAKRETVTVADAATYLGVSVGWLRQARRQQRGPVYLQIGRAIRYQIADLDRWLSDHVVQTDEP